MSCDLALYIHVPFCRQKCHYCSFISYEHREAAILPYLSALKKELAQRANGERLHSIYFGGGTPSSLSVKHISDILATINSLFILDKAAEITIEANPGTVDRVYLTELRKQGVNRLSLGVQSLNDSELVLLGRIHTAAEAKEAVCFARDSGFENLNLDLIYGLPGQTLLDWEHTLNKVLEMEPEHLSLYALSLEADTPMWQTINENRIPDIDHDLSADQYEVAEDILAVHGYQHYEISNWAREGRECHHNMVYWRNQPYLGVGAAAHSYLDGRRLANSNSLDTYMAAFANGARPAPDMDQKISPQLQLAETVILGLRLCEGVNLDNIRSRFGIDIRAWYRQQIGACVDYGLLEHADGHIKLTRRGRLLSNEVFWRFLPG